MNATKTKTKPMTAMAKAAIAMLKAEAYDCGGDDRWVFAGRYENGCDELVDAGLCQRHPKGLMIYSNTRRTLTSDGSVIGKQMYRLNHAGKHYAEGRVEELKESAP